MRPSKAGVRRAPQGLQVVVEDLRAHRHPRELDRARHGPPVDERSHYVYLEGPPGTVLALPSAPTPYQWQGAWRSEPVVGERGEPLEREPEDTAAGLDATSPGDGEAWLRLYDRWQREGRPILDAFMAPFPPVAPGLRAVARVGPRQVLPLLRTLLLPVRRHAHQFLGPSHSGAGLHGMGGSGSGH